MVANVFLFLLIVLAICRDGVQQYTNEPSCVEIRGVCTPMSDCQNISHIEAVSCPMQFEDGAVCCNPINIVDSRRHMGVCLDACSEQYTRCNQSCNRRYNRQYDCTWIDDMCIPTRLLNFRRRRN